MVHRPSFVDWQVPTSDTALPPMADEIMLVVYRSKVTLGVYYDTLERGRSQDAWHSFSPSPGRAMGSGSQSTHRLGVAAQLQTAPATRPPATRAGQAAIPAFRHHQQLALPALLRAHHPRLGRQEWQRPRSSSTAPPARWNTETADPRKLPRVPNR